MVALFCREKFLGALIYLTLCLPVHPPPPPFLSTNPPLPCPFSQVNHKNEEKRLMVALFCKEMAPTVQRTVLEGVLLPMLLQVGAHRLDSSRLSTACNSSV